MTRQLTEIADELGNWGDGTKARAYYGVYDRYLGELADRPVTMLELGVYHGESTKVFATYFKTGTVIAVDVEDRGVDFAGYPNVAFERADQRDAKRLREICQRHAPDGLDLVIDDAAHIGSWSQSSYRALMPLLRPGGFYIVEDWGTGYWNDWPDGRAIRPARSRLLPWGMQRRVRSHDFGMVGFVKSLADDVSTDVAPTRSAPRTQSAQLEYMHLYASSAVLKKRAV